MREGEFSCQGLRNIETRSSDRILKTFEKV